MNNPEYETYRKAFAELSKPCAYVDMDLLDQNASDILRRAAGKTVRIATKSVRSRFILKHLLEFDSGFKGLMCYSPWEACWLSDEGFDDIIVAYPTADKNAIREVASRTAAGRKIFLMTDHPHHVELIAATLGAASVPIWIDIDLSVSFPGLWFGVRRSPMRQLSELDRMLAVIRKTPQVQLCGLMGYEAQIAGLGDRVSGKGLLNPAVRFLKKVSRPRIASWRKKAVEHAESEGFHLQYVNGGGTGSVESTVKESVVTEVTVGSGFYAPTLFDYYTAFQHFPAAGFVLEVSRIPNDNTATCQYGGYIASGPGGREKQPQPFLPAGLQLLGNEMAGEVQTPLKTNGIDLKPGDPVFFRHAKAGELMERFNNIHLLRNGEIFRETKTYRGEGRNFG